MLEEIPAPRAKEITLQLSRVNGVFGLSLSVYGRVTEVDAGSAAFLAGVKPFDRIVRVDGRALEGTVGAAVAGRQTVEFTLERPPASLYALIAGKEWSPGATSPLSLRSPGVGCMLSPSLEQIVMPQWTGEDHSPLSPTHAAVSEQVEQNSSYGGGTSYPRGELRRHSSEPISHGGEAEFSGVSYRGAFRSFAPDLPSRRGKVPVSPRSVNTLLETQQVEESTDKSMKRSSLDWLKRLSSRSSSDSIAQARADQLQEKQFRDLPRYMEPVGVPMSSPVMGIDVD
ncbi:MAG: hypothetical protein SGPRY_008509 [Prymnesium sp.]